MSDVQNTRAVPRDFFCEHTATKSRVFALVEAAGAPASLRAVLTCNDAALARESASLLSIAWLGGPGAGLQAEAERICNTLPDAPAASLRQALGYALQGSWPADEGPGIVQGVTADSSEDDVEDDEEPSPMAVVREARTPEDARLADLTGKVVRVTQLLEVHVHDPERLVAAARMSGWEPLDDDFDDDPDDVVGAVMCLGTQPEIPGVDVISQEDVGELLRASAGDELTDWSTTPVTAEFSSGWRLRADARTAAATSEEPLPDFAALFALRDCSCGEDDCDTCGHWHLTPRTADLLHTALSIMADQSYDDAEGHADEHVDGDADDWSWSVFDRLPRITWRQDRSWRRQFARACDDLTSDIEHGHLPTPRCTAEEIALHLAIQDGPSYLEEQEDTQHQDHNALPTHEDDYDWDGCSEYLFQDSDALMLYNSALDGIEDPSTVQNKDLGVGDLRPSNWFKPFNNVQPRDQKRGLRR
jgi:hypothetical protein